MTKLSSHRTAAKTPRKTPETLRIASVTPSFTVHSVADSVAWYRDVLGFHVKEESKERGDVVGAVLQAGSARLVISQEDLAKGHPRRICEGFHIFCTTRQNLDELAAEIRRRGGLLAQEPADQPGGIREFSIVDPDGYQLRFSSSLG